MHKCMTFIFLSFISAFLIGCASETASDNSSDKTNTHIDNNESSSTLTTTHTHIAGETVIENEISPSCTENGSYDEVIYCTGCNEELSRVTKTIYSTGHDLIHVDGQSPSCTEDGWHDYDYCLNCDYSTYEKLNMLGHLAGNPIQENLIEPSCLNVGSYDLITYCLSCGIEIEREKHTIPALGHDIISYIGKSPTCTEDGWYAFDECSRCDYSTYEKINKLGHQAGTPEKENIVPADCVNNGSYDLVTYCSTCGVELTRETFVEQALQHNYEKTNETNPDYEHDGVITYTCSRCGDSYDEKGGDRLIHQYSNTYNYDEHDHWHDCIDEGYDNLKNAVEPHTFNLSVTNPTYGNMGYTTKTCSTCGYSYKTDYVEALAHSYSNEYSYDDNQHWFNCIDSGYETLKDGVENHSFDTVVIQPTYETQGYTHYFCECGYSYDADYTNYLSYSIEYNLNGGTNNNQNPLSYTIDDEYSLLDPTKDGFTFLGWYDNDNNLVTNINKGTKGFLSFSALWNDGNYYTITLNPEGGLLDTAFLNVQYNHSYSLPTPKKDGFTFEGWYYDNSVVNDDKWSISQNVVLNARWTPILHEFHVYPYDEAMGFVELTEGEGYSYETMTVAAHPYSNYVFYGWYNDEDRLVSTSCNYSFQMPLNSYELKARFISKTDELSLLSKAAIPVIDYDNNTVYYGLYPQSNVNDDGNLVNELEKITVSENGWYFYKGNYYAKAMYDYTKERTLTNGVVVSANNYYWFKCEPIKWRIWKTESDVYYILSDLVIDSCPYNILGSKTVGNTTIYCSNYEYSDVREWLNNYFYETAFHFNNEYIDETSIKNDRSTTNMKLISSYAYLSKDTTDYVYLLSYSDYASYDIGCKDTKIVIDNELVRNNRKAYPTDWAIFNRVIYSSSYPVEYMTRSPAYDSSYGSRSSETHISTINYNGYISISEAYRTFYSTTYNDGANGVRPAITLHIY